MFSQEIEEAYRSGYRAGSCMPAPLASSSAKDAFVRDRDRRSGGGGRNDGRRGDGRTRSRSRDRADGYSGRDRRDERAEAGTWRSGESSARGYGGRDEGGRREEQVGGGGLGGTRRGGQRDDDRPSWP
jgi:hypothetical protein